MMGEPLFWLGAVTLGLWLVSGIDVALGARRIRYLREVSRVAAADLPSVSVVVAARDEARGISGALARLLRQEGVELELIVVDDRSRDATAEIVVKYAAADDRVRSLRIDELPHGWLGKNHALHRGAEVAAGEWLLFTDADVEMEPWTVALALSFATETEVDHLAVTPELRMPTRLTDLFAGTFILLFARYSSPWKARDPGSRRAVGIGAFNLVRRTAYVEVDGHSRIPLRPDDDMALGRTIKSAGFRQDVLYGTGAVRVEWYPTLGEAVRGLEKNAFAGLGYSLAAVLAVCAGLFVFGSWPWLALLLTSGPTRWLFAGSVLVMSGLYVQSSQSSGADPRLVPALPFAFLLFVYIILRASALALARGGIRWRGTTYDLRELRRNRA